MKDALILILVWLTTSSAFILSRIENLKQRLPSSLRANSFTRSNPMSDKISAKEFHHIEFYCGDATTTYKRFQIGLGMHLVANSDQSTSNIEHCSYVLKSNNMTMVFTAPYSSEEGKKSCSPFPGFSRETCSNFFSAHGLGVRAVAITVDDVGSSFQAAIANGGREHIAPQKLIDNFGLGWVDYAEVFLYGDVVLRLINLDNYRGHFFPNFQDIKQTKPFQPPFSHLLSNPVYEPKRDDSTFGFSRFDHIVGNLWSLEPTLTTLKAMTGFHEFAEFVAGDVGTVDSGLNSVVLANNNEMVLLPLNEPTFGTKRKSQIQTYLEQNNGEGVQHIAMFTTDIFRTMRLMRAAGPWGGFDFLPPPPPSYYQALRRRLGPALSEAQYTLVEEMGLLADMDDQGVLLQVFTKPVGDRATLFLEVIQRVGCVNEEKVQKPGCGGFGKGNFRDLFKSIEDYEKSLNL